MLPGSVKRHRFMPLNVFFQKGCPVRHGYSWDGGQMFLHTSHPFIRNLSTSTKTRNSKAALNWRNKFKQVQLVSEISSILLQRHNWGPLLQSLNLSPKLTPYIFLQVLHKTQNNPQISLTFFNWAKATLGFQPDLKTQCKLTQVLIRFGLTRPVKPILDSLIRAHPPTQIVDSLVQSCGGTDSHSLVLSSLLEHYCHTGMYLQGLETFRKSVDNGHVLSVHSCNALLNLLQEKDERELAWCFLAAFLRNGLLPSQFTWSIIARVLYKNEKFDRICRIVDMGVHNSVIYGLLIEFSSKGGDFEAAFEYLGKMCERKLDPGFGSYSSILDGACKYENFDVVEKIIGAMINKELLSRLPTADYDLIIHKLSDLGKTYAAEMFIKRACEEKIELQNDSYGCMLRSLSKGGRMQDAIRLYGNMVGRGITINESCCSEFANALCREEPSEETSRLLKDTIRGGFFPLATELSKYISSECDNDKWREAEELLNAILEKGILPDSFCCCSLVEHYCSSGQIESAIALHHKMEKLGGNLDVTTYNVLLNGLFEERRIDDAARVFNHMRRRTLISSESFSTMIRGLCLEKDLREAMKLHDEMLKMGLKPDERTYKSLIMFFK